MISIQGAQKMVADRGPRFAVVGTVRQGELMAEYAITAEAAEAIYARYIGAGYRFVQTYPPTTFDLAALGRARNEAMAQANEATAILRAAVLRALEDGRSQSEVARTSGVARLTIREWASR